MTLVRVILFFLLLAAPLRAQAEPQDERWVRTALRFVNLLEDGDYITASQMRSVIMPDSLMTPVTLEKFWLPFRSAGALKSVMPDPVQVIQGFHVVDMSVTFGTVGAILRVALDATGKVVGYFVQPPKPPLYVPPTYVDTLEFDEIYLALDAGDVHLPAVLTMPRGRGRVPGVVLVHGSGPNDRDGTTGPNRPYRDIAWGLASRGIAVLRYDKRTLVANPADTRDITVEEEVILDALTALDSLRAHDRIDVRRTFVVGHSLGGMLAPEIARRDSASAGAVMLAATPRDLAQVMREQYEYLRTLPANAGEEQQRALRTALDALDRLSRFEPLPDERLLGVPAIYFYDLQKRNPMAHARALDIPLLFLQGARDYQVTLQDLALWQRGLAGRTNVAFTLYGDLNHNFVSGTGRATPTEYSRPGHVARIVVEDIARFILDTAPALQR